MQIRLATLDDTQAISALFCGQIERWQRMNAQGYAEDVPYERLSIYERWLHGGPWMSVETGAIWLNHLLGGAGLPYVVVDAGAVVGYAELFHSDEPPPYGEHWHIAQWVAGGDVEQVGDALLRWLMEQSATVGRLTVSAPRYDELAHERYARHGFTHLATLRQLTLSAQTGQSFYQAIEHPQSAYGQIEGWGMPLGRAGCARQHWETLWPALWRGIPPLQARRQHRLKLNASGQDAFVFCLQGLYDPRAAEIFCWSPKPLTAQALVSIRDWAHRAGYRLLSMLTDDKTAKLFPADAEPSPHEINIYQYCYTA